MPGLRARLARQSGREAGEATARAFAQAEDVERFETGETEGGRALTVLELQRQDTHADQVVAVDAFI